MRTDDLHVLVFKDDRKARAFRLSESWFNRLGVAVIALTLVTVASSLLAVRAYRLQRDLDPSHLRDLEGQVEALKEQLDKAKTSLATAPSLTPPAATDSETPPPVVASPTVTVSALPDFSTVTRPEESTLPFAVKLKKISWSGGKVIVRFNIEYTRNDGGSQQGRIVLTARGPGKVVAYPKTLFPSGQPISLRPELGEYFSVARLRVTNAEFPGFPQRSDLDFVDAHIFDQSGQLLYFERFTPPAQTPAPKPAEGTDAAAPSTTEGTPSPAPTEVSP